jgi:hypothetical protein
MNKEGDLGVDGKGIVSGLVPDVLRCRGVNRVFGDVGRVIPDAFQTAGD